MILEKSLVIYFVSVPMEVNLAHIVFEVSFLSNLFLFLVGMHLFMCEGSYLLLHNVCFIVLFSFSLFLASKLYVSILLVRYLTAANLCSSR